MSGKFEPKITGFFCKWCTSAGADLVGTTRPKYSPNVVPVIAFCSSRIDPQHVLRAFRDDADGVLTAAATRATATTMPAATRPSSGPSSSGVCWSGRGIEEERLRLEWISAAEGDKFARVIRGFTKEVRDLGPLNLAQFAPAGRMGVVKEMK